MVTMAGPRTSTCHNLQRRRLLFRPRHPSLDTVSRINKVVGNTRAALQMITFDPNISSNSRTSTSNNLRHSNMVVATVVSSSLHLSSNTAAAAAAALVAMLAATVDQEVMEAHHLRSSTASILHKVLRRASTASRHRRLEDGAADRAGVDHSQADPRHHRDTEAQATASSLRSNTRHMGRDKGPRRRGRMIGISTRDKDIGGKGSMKMKGYGGVVGFGGGGNCFRVLGDESLRETKKGLRESISRAEVWG